MKYLLFVIYFIASLFFLIYLALPNLSFPEPPAGSFRSVEPADSETPLRRAYFTNYDRQEVLDHYQNKFKLSFLGFDIPSYKLIYPPEDAYPLIRDQTRSTHLEEVVYPFRESFFVNEFVPQEAKDDIWYKGVHYEQKITVKIKQSNRVLRFVAGIVTLFCVWLVGSEFVKASKSLISRVKKLNWPFFWN